MRIPRLTVLLSVVYLLAGGTMVTLGLMWVASSARYPEGAFISVPAGLGLVALGGLLLLGAALGIRRSLH